MEPLTKWETKVDVVHVGLFQLLLLLNLLISSKDMDFPLFQSKN